MHMYKRLTVVAAALTALLIAVPAAAQTQQRRENSGLGIGALGGITWTSANTENSLLDTSFDSGTGWMAGIWFGGNRDGRVGLMGEVSWVVKKNKITDFGEEFTQTLSYVEIPVLLRINAGSLNREKPSLYFLVGPVFDIQVKNELEGVDSPDDVYEGLDIGLMAGVGFEVVRIGIEGRYSWGLKSVLATDAALDSGFGDTKLNTFQVVFKVRFN